VEEAQRALLAAKVESSSASNGVGLVRLMGRESGFIAMQASMASGRRSHFHRQHHQCLGFRVRVLVIIIVVVIVIIAFIIITIPARGARA
jgi:6-phosphofructokinase